MRAKEIDRRHHETHHLASIEVPRNELQGERLAALGFRADVIRLNRLDRTRLPAVTDLLLHRDLIVADAGGGCGRPCHGDGAERLAEATNVKRRASGERGRRRRLAPGFRTVGGCRGIEREVERPRMRGVKFLPLLDLVPVNHGARRRKLHHRHMPVAAAGAGGILDRAEVDRRKASLPNLAFVSERTVHMARKRNDLRMRIEDAARPVVSAVHRAIHRVRGRHMVQHEQRTSGMGLARRIDLARHALVVLVLRVHEERISAHLETVVAIVGDLQHLPHGLIDLGVLFVARDLLRLHVVVRRKDIDLRRQPFGIDLLADLHVLLVPRRVVPFADVAKVEDHVHMVGLEKPVALLKPAGRLVELVAEVRVGEDADALRLPFVPPGRRHERGDGMGHERPSAQFHASILIGS